MSSFFYSIGTYCYLYVSFCGSITSVGEERANLSATVYLYVVSVRRGFLFLLMLGIGCVILLWHSLGLSYIILHFEILANQLTQDVPSGLSGGRLCNSIVCICKTPVFS